MKASAAEIAALADEVTTLAALSDIDYELQRQPAAKRLGIRLGDLDRWVANRHRPPARRRQPIKLRPDNTLAARDGSCLLCRRPLRKIKTLFPCEVTQADGKSKITLLVCHDCSEKAELAELKKEEGDGPTDPA